MKARIYATPAVKGLSTNNLLTQEDINIYSFMNNYKWFKIEMDITYF